MQGTKSLRFILPFLVFGLRAAGQTHITIVLKNPGQHKIDKVDAFDLSQKEIYNYKYKDTLLLKFKKKNIDCYNIRYHENGKMFRQQIWLDSGTLKIEAHLADSSLVIDTVINSPFYYKVAAFNEKYLQLNRSHDTAAINDFLLTSFEENIENPYSINIGYYYVLRNQNSKSNLTRFKSLTDKQGDRFNWFLLYPTVVGRMDKILSTDKIDLPAYSFLNKDNLKTQLQLNGAEYYVLDFWFLACKPCVTQHIEIKKRLPDLNNKGIELIGISTDRDFKKWKQYLTKHGYQWPNYLEDKKHNITADQSISAFPTYMILNSKGDIVDSYNSFSDVLKRFGMAE
jgi:peroxiredoxin